MPEGHTIHRLARRQTADLVGQTIEAASPQHAGGSSVRAAAAAGRAAQALDGRRLERIDAYGKHLLHRYEDELTLHVHLGLFGRFAHALSRRRISIAAALMDQSVLAGVGNVYRAESLFAVGLDPFTPARDVPPSTVDALWATLVTQLRDGEKAGKIVTVPAAEAGRPRSKLTGRDRVQVYRRAECRRCTAPVARQELTGRTLWWCPSCQGPTPR